MIAHTYQEKK